ncbi:MAG: hypothetical protein ACI8W7_001572 [Gammaproteobacteria bacterium]|jgi:hypothetical protein
MTIGPAFTLAQRAPGLRTTACSSTAAVYRPNGTLREPSHGTYG